MNYYNEYDPKAAAWLRELIRAGEIPPGDVDERSILEVSPYDLTGYTQCHFFAGIGGWPLALRLANWPDDKPAWSGSCPCQPFSLGNTARLGVEDERHLWPVFAQLIRVHKPIIVFGEQVDDAIPLGWLDEVFADLELEGYACAATVLPARAYGAEHWRDRIFWVADSSAPRLPRHQQIDRIPLTTPATLSEHGDPLAGARRALAGDWADLPLGDGVSVGLVRGVVSGAGNAIVPQVAAEFVSAYLDATEPANHSISQPEK